MVGAAGFEPATSRPPAGRAASCAMPRTHLSQNTTPVARVGFCTGEGQLNEVTIHT